MQKIITVLSTTPPAVYRREFNSRASHEIPHCCQRFCRIPSRNRPRAISASFDCNKATNDVEILICKDAKTSAPDEKLQKTYESALAAAAPSSKRAVIEEQRHWITYTRDVCQNETCPQQAYTARIALLARDENYIIDDSSCELVGDGGACVN